MIYKLQIIGLQIVQLLSPHMALWTAKQPPGEVERAEDLLPQGTRIVWGTQTET